jgi:hypothetical protein
MYTNMMRMLIIITMDAAIMTTPLVILSKAKNLILSTSWMNSG